MSALINQHPYFDVEFGILNDLANRLRTAGAKFSVRKVASKHRITVVKEPTIATVEQIITYTIGRNSIDAPEESNNDMALAPFTATSEETTDTPLPQELAVPLESEVSQKLAVAPQLAVPQESVAPQKLAIAPALASSTELLSLTLEKLKKLAKLHKIIGFSKLKRETLASKLEGLVTKEQLV